ncbi:GNAT family N-acetyltransferase [uncultured Bacteroides sp.]|uniref:GNAT family N-acetyltransferase n=1 Tax=uncultured Bacteroides sp. TaxID=162156 RepID=UPI0025F566AA|nr:GNAT family N-acetyltransferase [uncultured Bacteroides sp.]
MNEDYKLIDNEENNRYEFQIDGKIAEIDYIKSDGEIYFVHTEVPASLGGKGVGSQLAEKALTDVERQDLRLVPLCPFIAGYIKKHPEWKRIVMRGKHIQ